MTTHPLAAARLSELLIPFLNYLLDGDLWINFFDFRISFFPDFNLDFVAHTDFTRIAASNTATNDVTY